MNKKKCDLLIRNACIVSMNSSRTIFSPGAVAVSKSRIVDVGSDSKITQRIDAKEIIDAKVELYIQGSLMLTTTLFTQVVVEFLKMCMILKTLRLILQTGRLE